MDRYEIAVAHAEDLAQNLGEVRLTRSLCQGGKMRVLMVYPRYPVTYWGFQYALRFIGKKAAHQPLGLMTVAAMLPDEWTIKLIDCNVERLRGRHFKDVDVVFVSAMSIQRDDARRILAACSEKGIPVVAGGPLFSSEPEAFADVDHLLVGEAEGAIEELIMDLESGCARHLYESPSRPSIKRTPSPRWDLVKMPKYAQMTVQYSRGCPFDCEFCDIGVLFGRGVRTKRTEQFLREFDSLLAAGWRGDVFFVDDNFAGNRKRLKTEFMPALNHWMEAHERPFSFGTEVSVDIADDPGLVESMVHSGFHSVFVGIETVNDRSLEECDKEQNRGRDLAASVKTLQQAGLEVSAGFILGFDSDTPSVFDRVQHFIQETGIARAMVGLLNAPPGTRLYERLRGQNRLLGNLTGDNMDGSINFLPTMGLDTLQRGYHKVVASLYEPSQYYARVRTFLSVYAQPRLRVHLKACHIRALFGSVIRIGLIGAERREFWSLLVWTVRRSPRLLPKAITMAIYGFHFRKLYT